MIDNGDFKRISRVPSDFEQRRIAQVVDDFMSREVPGLHRGPGELRYKARGRTIEFYEAQPHPVHVERIVRLPVALLQGNPDGVWSLYYRGTRGHWEAHPEGSDLPLGSALALMVRDELGVFW